MKRLLLASLAALALVAAPAALAQSPQRDFRFALDLGLTGGGDKLATVTFNDGSTESVRAGGLLQIGAGFLWQPGWGPVALQTTMNYHVDDVSARNGSLTFSRYPLEVIGYITAVPNWRFGAGPRFVFSPKLESDFPGFNSTIKFEDTIGGVFEVGYRPIGQLWVNLRFTAEKYKVKSISGANVVDGSEVSGNSLGVNLVYAF
jgi:hypothetical protein